MLVSESVSSKSLSKRSDMSSPLLLINGFCFDLSGSCAIWLTMRESSRILANVSTMAMVVSTAFLLFRIVASMYKPFSVKATGKTVECFNLLNRSKFLTSSNFSSFVVSIIYLSENLSGLFFTAWLIYMNIFMRLWVIWRFNAIFASFYNKNNFF